MCCFLEIDDHFLINYGGGLGYSTEICDERKRFENMCNVQTLNIAISFTPRLSAVMIPAI